MQERLDCETDPLGNEEGRAEAELVFDTWESEVLAVNDAF
jgi:hypothetical protein